MAISAFVKAYDQFILDLDGCVWVGDEAVPGSVEAITALREAGKRIAFVTNNARHPTEEVVQKLWGLGVKASLADVVTVGGAMQHLLAETRRGMTVFVIGTQTMVEHVADAGLRVLNGTDLASRAELVVVSATSVVDYDDLRNATLALHRGADFVATS
ncbi:MAG: HAD-IIA family hydrolase, partial [Thermoleophilaceae bacterium]